MTDTANIIQLPSKELSGCEFAGKLNIPTGSVFAVLKKVRNNSTR